MGWKWGTKSKWYNGNSRKHTRYDLNYDWQGNTRTNRWATTWTTGSTRWAKRTTNRQQRKANKLCIAYELYEDEQWQEELWEQQVGWEYIESAKLYDEYLDSLMDEEFYEPDHEYDWDNSYTGDDWYDCPDW